MLGVVSNPHRRASRRLLVLRVGGVVVIALTIVRTTGMALATLSHPLVAGAQPTAPTNSDLEIPKMPPLPGNPDIARLRGTKFGTGPTSCTFANSLLQPDVPGQPPAITATCPQNGYALVIVGDQSHAFPVGCISAAQAGTHGGPYCSYDTGRVLLAAVAPTKDATFARLVLLAAAVARLPNVAAINFDLTTPVGWNYRGVLPLPTASISVSQYIKASPPGLAQAALKLVTEHPVHPLTFSDDNAGRPDGPKLTVAPGTLAFKVPASVMNKLSSDMLTSSGDASIGYNIGPCELYAPYQGFWPFATDGNEELTCPPTNGAGTETYSVPERDVVALSAAVRNEEPAYIINLDPSSSYCNEIIYPSGAAAQAPGFASRGCGTLRIRVTR